MLAIALLFSVPQAWARSSDESAVVVKPVADGTGYASLVQLSYLRDPSANGRVLLVFEQPGMAGIPLYASRTDGDHWTFVQNVTDQAQGADARWQLRWQPNISETPRPSGPLPTGTVLLAANATGNNDKGQVIAQDLQLYASQDAGRTWRYRGSIIKGGGRPENQANQGVWEPEVKILDDGRMMAYYSSEQHKRQGYNQLLAHKVSADGGRSWGPETIDVAVKGGVERPRMAVVTRLPDGRYVMSFEDIDGPDNGQVRIKFSRDGLDWGDPGDRGIPVQTQAGQWPAATPIVKWLPLGGPHGVLVVLAGRAGGGGDEAGHSVYWNNNAGRGPWWEAPAPAQKLSGNIHAGWTQALLLQKDGKLLQVTSSSPAKHPHDARGNTIIYAAARMDFYRYEAEDAARHAAVQISDDSASNGRKARVASMAAHGALTFDVHQQTPGSRVLRLRWRTVAFPGAPKVSLRGQPVSLTTQQGSDGWEQSTGLVRLPAGDSKVVMVGAAHAVDVDYLELDPQ